MKKYKEIISYLIFGILTTALNFVSYYIFTRIFELDFIVSNVIAWILSVIFAYVTNKFFVFESKNIQLKFIIAELSSFIGARLFSGIVDIVFMFIVINIMSMNDMVAKIISNIIVIIMNYILSKILIFRRGNNE